MLKGLRISNLLFCLKSAINILLSFLKGKGDSLQSYVLLGYRDSNPNKQNQNQAVSFPISGKLIFLLPSKLYGILQSLP